jgi:hypothetical protein
LHSPSGLAVARFNGVDFYPGQHGSRESRDEYDRLLGEWMMKGRQAPTKAARSQVGQMSVNELSVFVPAIFSHDQMQHAE